MAILSPPISVLGGIAVECWSSVSESGVRILPKSFLKKNYILYFTFFFWPLKARPSRATYFTYLA